MKNRFILVAVAVALVSAGALAKDKNLPETSPEGLVLQKGKAAKILYVRPGVDFSVYKRIAILECPVAFRKNWQKDQNSSRTGLSSQITAEDMDRIRKGLGEEFIKVFTDELQNKGGYPVVTTGGEDVLVIRPAIFDLDIAAPDKMTAGRSYTITESAGGMSLLLELYDSVSGQILARAVDRENDNSATLQFSNRVTNVAEADRILRRWASALRKRLDEVHGKGKD
jgi:hypothetical protein